MQSSAVVAHQAHNLRVASSNLASALTLSYYPLGLHALSVIRLRTGERRVDHSVDASFFFISGQIFIKTPLMATHGGRHITQILRL